MKRFKFVFVLFAVFLLLTGCDSNSNLKDLSYKELNKKLRNKESFFFVLVQDGCSHCASFTPKLESVLKEYDITAI